VIHNGDLFTGPEAELIEVRAAITTGIGGVNRIAARFREHLGVKLPGRLGTNGSAPSKPSLSHVPQNADGIAAVHKRAQRSSSPIRSRP